MANTMYPTLTDFDDVGYKVFENFLQYVVRWNWQTSGLLQA